MSGIREALPSIAALTASAALLAGCGGQPTHHDTYYALGDSVAAGLGLQQSHEASPQDKACGRSPDAYPAIVAADLHLALANVACSGAVTANLPAQLDEAFTEGPPNVITITVGANDADWTGFLEKCFGSCNTPANTKVVNADLAHLSHGLEEDLQSIQKRSSAGRVPTTVVTGYYNPVSSQCTSISPSSLSWLNKEVGALNTTLETVTQHFSFARFAPVEESFVGYDACSSQSWVQTSVSSPGYLHPTTTGQQAIAEAVIHALAG